jgi:putative Ca2+/H+ antiporter (TMEM165/GDT1 family)
LAYWTVLVAELVGDKSIYTVSSLGMRFRGGVVFGSVVAAFAGKMLVAVLLGRALVQWHSRWTDMVSALAFFLSAMLIWFDEPEEELPATRPSVPWPRAGIICFAALFFTEWGDPGQIAAAAITLKSGAMLATWAGGTLAMITKGALAMTLGRKLRDHLPQRMIRMLASASCGALGLIALGSVVFR